MLGLVLNGFGWDSLEVWSRGWYTGLCFGVSVEDHGSLDHWSIELASMDLGLIMFGCGLHSYRCIIT